MLIRHLKFFVALAEEQHFGRAAERCNITQPTLSLAIKKLEEELDVTLIVRGHRFMALTPEGEKTLVWGRHILADYDSLQGAVGRARQGLTGVLRLGVIPAAMPSVSFVSERFAKRHPAVQIEILSMTSRAIQAGLENHDLDGGLTYLENEPLENVLRIPLYRERFVFACLRDHPFADRENISWAEAAAQPLCLLSEDMQNRRIINQIAAKAGVRAAPRIVSNSFLGVCSHLRNGRWNAILPHTFFYILGDRAAFTLLELIDPIESQLIGLVLSDRSPQSPMAGALVAALEGADIERRFLDAAPHIDRPIL